MHFVIYTFITCVCIAGLILFSELFNRAVKLVVAAIAIFTGGSALTILINRIGILSNQYLFPLEQYRFYTVAAVLVVTVIGYYLFTNKKKA